MDIDRQDEKALLECLGAVKPRVCSCTEQDVLSKMRCSTVHLSKEHLSKVHLSKVHLSKVHLSKVQLSKVQLSKVQLSKALLKIDSIDFGSLRRVFTFVFTT